MHGYVNWQIRFGGETLENVLYNNGKSRSGVSNRIYGFLYIKALAVLNGEPFFSVRFGASNQEGYLLKIIE